MAVGSKPMRSHFGIGEFTTRFRLPILVVGLGCNHWGYGVLTHGQMDLPLSLFGVVPSNGTYPKHKNVPFCLVFCSLRMVHTPNSRCVPFCLVFCSLRMVHKTNSKRICCCHEGHRGDCPFQLQPFKARASMGRFKGGALTCCLDLTDLRGQRRRTIGQLIQFESTLCVCVHGVDQYSLRPTPKKRGT